MVKGQHYWESFSPAPSITSSRILQAIAAGQRLHRLCWDIKLAYCWAELPQDEVIALRYPKGCERYHPVTGEELFVVQRKNLYGAPSGMFHWGNTRDAFFLKKFNEDSWTCNRCKLDPCLFTITAPASGMFSEGSRMWLIVHSDDVDLVGENLDNMKKIAEWCEEEWKIKMVDPDFILGIKRTRFERDGEEFCEISMEDYIDDLGKTLEEFLPKRQARTPFPEGRTLSKTIDPPSDEEAKVIKDRGYKKAVGMLLWCSRNVFIECSAGVNYLCRVMQSPNEQAWKCAMHMVSYLLSVKSRGILYSSKSSELVAFYDSSNNPDFSDGKCMYGYSIHLYGGPVCWISRKHNHVGMSAGHNEYMALSHCCKVVKWIRQLLEDIGQGDLLQGATKVYGDNSNAVSLAKENRITPGNRFFLVDYHYSKEAYEMGFIDSLKIGTDDNVADVLTKALTFGKLEKLCGRLCGYTKPLVQHSIKNKRLLS